MQKKFSEISFEKDKEKERQKEEFERKILQEKEKLEAEK